MAINIPTSGLVLGFQLMSIISVLIAVFRRNWVFFGISMGLVVITLVSSYFVTQSKAPASGQAKGTAKQVSFDPAPPSVRTLQDDYHTKSEKHQQQSKAHPTMQPAQHHNGVPAQKAVDAQTQPPHQRPMELPRRKGFDTQLYANPYMDMDAAKQAYAASYGIEVITPPPEDVNAFQQFIMRGKFGSMDDEYMQEIH